jgi:peroxiredoxin
MIKKHKLLLILFFLINITNAQIEKNSFIIKGEIVEKIKNNYIYLDYNNKKDSSLIVNNKFIFKGRLINEPIQGIFSFKNKGTGIPGFYIENTKIEIKLSLKPTKNKNSYNLNIISVNGTKTIGFQNTLEKLYKNRNNEKVRTKILYKLDSLVKNYPNNPYLTSYLYRLTNHIEFDKNILSEIYSLTNKEIQPEFLKKQIKENLLIKNKKDFLEYGLNIPNIQLPNIEGNIYDISELKGKWILIDFWASWCFPCIKEFPNLKIVYNKFKSKNFEIVGISIEEDKEEWLKSIRKNSLNWINLNENNKLSGKVMNELNVKQIPTNFLINPNGKIILKNVSPNDLYNFLNKIE